jgi:superfamily I DNA/RNA helicase
MAKKKARTNNDTLSPEWFDFVEQYGQELDESLKFSVTESINRARALGISNPEYALIECRKVAESMVNRYDGGSHEKMARRLFDLKVRNSITAQQLGWLEYIWKKASIAAHPTRKELEYDVSEVLENLDRSLRVFIKDKIDKTYVAEQQLFGSLFIDEPRNETESLLEIAVGDSTITKLHGDELVHIEQAVDTATRTEDELDQHATEIRLAIIEADSNTKATEARLSSKLEMIHTLENEIAGLPVDSEASVQFQAMLNREKTDYAAFTKELSDTKNRRVELLEEYSSVLDSKKDIQSDFEKTSERLEEILAEHDWIARMLNGKGKATEKQREIINRNDNILRIRGGAGTGKSLVLLTKCLRELDREAFAASQEALSFDDPDFTREALLITYNTTLRNYLQGILDSLSESDDVSETVKRSIGNIHIHSYDSFLLSKLKRYSEEYAQCDIAYDNTRRPLIKNLIANSKSTSLLFFLEEEFAWMQAIEGLSLEQYRILKRPGARKSEDFNMQQNSNDRDTVYALYQEFVKSLRLNNLCTISELTIDLLGKVDDLPKFDVIAIDEAQDLDLIRIKLLYNLQKDKSSKFYIVYDEEQKIFQSTFSANELDGSLKNFRGHGVVFEVNHRNHKDIARFAAALKDGDIELPSSSEAIRVCHAQVEQIIDYVTTMPSESDTIAILLWKNSDIETWASLIARKGIRTRKVRETDGITTPGIYLGNLWSIKGLEFDWVLVPQMNDDRSYYYHTEQHNNLYYVAFTRARNHLEIFYQDIPHQILLDKYKSLLPEGTTDIWNCLEPVLQSQGIPTSNTIEGLLPITENPFEHDDDDIPF